MPAFPREELEEMMRRWLAANKAAEAAGDWKPMAEFYTADAEYTWNLGPTEEFIALCHEVFRHHKASAQAALDNTRKIEVEPLPLFQENFNDQ